MSCCPVVSVASGAVLCKMQAVDGEWALLTHLSVLKT